MDMRKEAHAVIVCDFQACLYHVRQQLCAYLISICQEAVPESADETVYRI